MSWPVGSEKADLILKIIYNLYYYMSATYVPTE